MAHILLVEDEHNLGMGLSFNLEAEGHAVRWVDNGFDALEALGDAADGFDLVILDVMMEGIDGFEVARRIRRAENYVPILMLTARDLVEDRVEGLTAGADDYLTKPFALAELLARASVLLRRQRWAARATGEPSGGPESLSFGDNSVDFRTFEATGPRGEVKLTAMEVGLLRYLASRATEVVSRSELLEEVWGISGQVSTRTVDNFMVRLRRHFEADPRTPRHFVSVRGVGYRFVP